MEWSEDEWGMSASKAEKRVLAEAGLAIVLGMYIEQWDVAVQCSAVQCSSSV